MLKFSNVKTIPHLNIIYTSPMRGLALTACLLCACSTALTPAAEQAVVDMTTENPVAVKSTSAESTLSVHADETKKDAVEPASGHGADSGSHHDGTDEARPYDETRNAQLDVAQALEDAATYNKRAMIVMGANWCHDSRALATHFETERFQTLLNPNYIVTYVDVGQKDRNEDIARNFGLSEGIVGTPTVIITDNTGTVLNLDTAPTWRNAASRSEDETFEYFENFAKASSTP